MYKLVDDEFFKLPTLDLAKKLIGCFLVHEVGSERLVGRIVETEAYKGPEDRAAHSFNNRRTPRTEIMFHEAGLVYTYQMHTHTLINVVSGPVDVPHAILIRAVEPVEGIEIMRENRGRKFRDIDLTNGPGKLTKAFGITMDYYGHYWGEKPLYIAEGNLVGEIETGNRIGIQNSGQAVHYPWRFFERGNRFVSR